MTLLALLILCHLLVTIDTQRNFARDGTASQSSTLTINRFSYGASLAIDAGEPHDFKSKSCSVTDTGHYAAWWVLEFDVGVFVTEVDIIYRNETIYRFSHYGLYVSNTTVPSNGKPTGHLCYQHPGQPDPSPIENVTCNAFGKNVIVYNHRNRSQTYPGVHNNNAYVELCDVEVYGCSKGTYGSGCMTQCPINCLDGHCFPQNGSCIWGCNGEKCLNNKCNATSCVDGCKPGYNGTICDEVCTSPNYGSNCKHKCHCLNNEVCNIKNGFCPGGCAKGWQGSNCSTECNHGYFGFSCKNECAGCILKNCDRFEGICNTTDRCNIGWIPVGKCDTKCSSGNFGENCNSKCFCQTPTCNHTNGICPDGGCQRGYVGDTCSDECASGRFGYNCNETCSGCILEKCDRISGNCSNTTHCKPGWSGTKCDQPCDQGKFGRDCINVCHCLNQPCNHITGLCPSDGCKRGYMGNNCTTKCNIGKYGYGCNETCSGCVADECDGDSGDCQNTTHCKPGWLGKKCDKHCQNGTFGKNCENNCSTCLNSICDHVDGRCIYGCKLGYDGYKCLILALIEDDTSSNGGIIGAAAGSASVVIVIMLIVIIIVIRRRLQTNKKENRLTDPLEKVKAKHNIYINAKEHTTDKTDDIYVNVGVTIEPEDIKVDYLRIEENEEEPFASVQTDDQINNTVVGDTDNVYYDNAKLKFATSDLPRIISEKKENDGFKKEYMILPKGLTRPHEEASKEENLAKNRFLHIWPYDHSRVVLQGNQSSDYINASYIDSYSKNKAYIATQGPRKSTCKDFWQMIWQENVEKVVMVTRLFEEGRDKCAQYWPDDTKTPKTFGDLKIAMKEETEHSVYVYRKIRLFNKQTKTDRIVQQFHFTQWPDHGVPDKVKLVSFYRKVKHAKTTLNGPLLVHCSAGIGRTGTFIAIDALHEEGQKTGYIDIMEYVQMMRKDRMNMIQTHEQYTAVFEALLELFTVPETAIDRDNFIQRLQQHQKSLKQEFKRLQELKPSYDKESFKTSRSKANSQKNVVQNILPHDKFRPYLMSYEKTRNDYINAVAIPEYIGKQSFYVTQYPMKETLVDFWTLVYDHNCTTVVLLEKQNEDTPLFPEQNGEFDFKVLTVKEKTLISPMVSAVCLLHKEKKEQRVVRIFSMNDWDADNIPSSTAAMLELLNAASSWRKEHHGSVAVVCRDGCSRCGVFVAIGLTMEKLEIDGEVDIFQGVRTMQERRPEFLPTCEQYEFCYQCIGGYLENMEGDSLYANT